MTVTNLHAMTIVEANDLLDSIGYRSTWTMEEMRSGADRLPTDVRQRLPEALHITAAAAQTEATALRAEVTRRAQQSRTHVPVGNMTGKSNA